MPLKSGNRDACCPICRELRILNRHVTGKYLCGPCMRKANSAIREAGIDPNTLSRASEEVKAIALAAMDMLRGQKCPVCERTKTLYKYTAAGDYEYVCLECANTINSRLEKTSVTSVMLSSIQSMDNASMPVQVRDIIESVAKKPRKGVEGGRHKLTDGKASREIAYGNYPVACLYCGFTYEGLKTECPKCKTKKGELI